MGNFCAFLNSCWGIFVFSSIRALFMKFPLDENEIPSLKNNLYLGEIYCLCLEYYHYYFFLGGGGGWGWGGVVISPLPVKPRGLYS